jgi:glycosyltransferase involved in cell wall biosynthesis
MPHVVLITNSGWSMVRHRREQIKGLVEQGWKVSAVSALNREQQEELRALGAEPYVVSCEGIGANPIKNLIYFYKVGNLLMRLRPTVVHNFSTKPVVMATLAAKAVGVKTIVCTFPGMGVIGTGRYSRLHGLIKRLCRLVLKGRTVTVFQNTEDMRNLVDSGMVQEHRCTVIPGCGVDIAALAPKFDPPESPRFVMVSRMTRSKGVMEFVESARSVKEAHPEAEFLLVGPADTDYGRQDPDYVDAKWLEQLSGSPARWLGRVSPDRAESIIREATALVLLSTAPEGIPRVLVEAAALGTPIITTDWPGCRDVVQDCVSGFLCRPDHAAKDAERAMLRLLEEDGLAKKMRVRGPEIAEKFDKSRMMAKTLQIYGGPYAADLRRAL